MRKIYLKNSIISFLLVVSTILTPLSFIPKEADAQSVSGSVTGISFNALPQCADVSLSTKLLFYGALGALGSILSGNSAAFTAGSALGSAASSVVIDSLTETIHDAVEEEISNANAVATYDASGNKKLDDLLKKSDKISSNVSSIKDNSTCTAAIGRIITKMLLQKLTVSTVNWINGGFDGSPSFIQDPNKFFGDIAKNEVLQFSLEIDNLELFPFGKAWIQNTAAAFNSKFQDNAQYSLDRLIQNTNPEYSAATFRLDFSQGGWNAWTAMTQAPQNNALGFQLMADNELQRRLAGTVQSTADAVHEALSQANGFLGDYRCIDPEGVTKQEDENARVERSATIGMSPNQKKLHPYRYRVCNQWKYVTPGSMIADAATSTITTTKDSLLAAEDLNDAIAAVTDALISRFSSDLMEKGFANIDIANIGGSSSFGSDEFRTQAEKDFIPSQLASSWLSANPDFNIRTDLTQALIDEQRTYSDKLKLQNKELMSTTDGKVYKLDATTGLSNAYGLIPAIYQLDYCIPGPHPGFEQDSRITLSDKTSSILYVTKQSTLLGQIVDGFLSSIPLIGSLIDIEKQIEARTEVRKYYAYNIYNLTGYLPDFDNDNDARANNLMSNQGIIQVLDEILNRYIQIIYKTYFSNPEIMPEVTKDAAENFNKLNGYNQMIKNNEKEITSLKSTIEVLGEIKKAVSALNNKYKPNGRFASALDEEKYESELRLQVNKFGRLSASMVNGADIASVDNLLKQIIDEKNFAYKNLLKGPYGCETQIETKSKRIEELKAKTTKSEYEKEELATLRFPEPWNNYDINTVKRMTYPFPIIYDYNVLAGGATIPDPWGKDSDYCKSRPADTLCASKSENKMPAKNDYAAYGPGFLSFVTFSAENGGGSGGANRRGPERLWIHDLVPQKEDAGMRDRPLGLPGGPFETNIGIY